MSRTLMPESCSYCPHYEPWHAACRHPLHQDVVRELADGGDECPLYTSIRADAMRDLSDSLQ